MQKWQFRKQGPFHYADVNTVRCRDFGGNVRRVDPRNFASLQELSVCRLSYLNRIDADVSVTCDDRDRSARQYIRYPCLVAEVLSPSTEAVDRGEKFRQYRRIETLREYLLIDPDRLSLECYRLNERGNWELFHFFASGSEAGVEDCEVELTSVGARFSRFAAV